MIRKSIAAFVLTTLCWLSMPGAFGSVQMGAMHPEKRDTSSPHEHACCPQLHPRITPILFLANDSPAMPCGEQHPCCARRVPSNPTTLPVEAKVVRPPAERSLAVIADESLAGRTLSAGTSVICFLPPPFERSAVLRN